MYDKSQMRSDIINFFTKFCDNKLNKNVYNINFYKKRNCEHIYEYLQLYWQGTPLENKSIAQKYYHIFWNTDVIPSTEFCNFVVGYRKGKRASCIKSKTIQHLQQKLQEWKTVPALFLDEQASREKLLKYLKTVNYNKLLEQKDEINAIYTLYNNIQTDNFSKLVLFCHGQFFCVCGKIKKIITPLVVRETCGSKNCVSYNLSVCAQNRDLSHLQSETSKKNRANARKNYRHTEETIEKIRNTNKKTWTPEKKNQQLEANRKNGVYEKLSNTIKHKILNGLYTPKSQNRLNHKRLKSELTGINNYRSSWELKYHEKNPHLEYETLRVPYFFNDNQHVYIVDFWDAHNKIAIEVKPESLLNSPKVQAKLDALKQWCKDNAATFIIVTEKQIFS